MTSFNVYKLRDSVRLKSIDFDTAIDHESRLGQRTKSIGPVTGDGYEAKLFYATDFSHQPRWADFVRSGFGEGVRFPNTASSAAVIVVKVNLQRHTHYLAFVFGTGWHLLRDDAIARNFGFRVALNVMFEGDSGGLAFDPSRIRAVDAKRVDQTTVRSRRQATRKTNLESFDLDLDRDLLNGITGQPEDEDTWGRRITGTDSLQIQIDAPFDQLGDLSKKIVNTHAKQDYKKRFGFIDDVSMVKDVETTERLEQEVIQRLRAKRASGFDLSPPQMVDWLRVVTFRFPGDKSGRSPVDRVDMDLNSLLISLSGRGRLEEMTVDYLRSAKIEAYDGEGKLSEAWSIWRCLSGELRVGDESFILDGGDFYEINRDYARSLDSYLIRNLLEANVVLPAAKYKEHEGKYNARAAKENPDLLLMDKVQVQPRRGTTTIEVCDLLSAQGQLVHVKRKLGSQLLSHLFSQGYVSADLLLNDDEFRSRTQTKVQRVAGDRSSSFPDFSRAKPQDLEVVFGVIANWKPADSVASRLPFFSKVNLRRHVQELKAKGYGVSFSRIDLVLGDSAK